MGQKEMRFAQKLRGMRAERRMTQAQLAKAVGTTDESVRHWEQGDYMPNLSTAVKLADALQCPLDQLAGRDIAPAIP